ncbi:MAG: hypothetical protein AABW91_01920 [Nanoarchaeota archaeon]
MERKTASILYKICYGTALIGAIGAIMDIATFNESNTNELNGYILLSAEIKAYSSLAIGSVGLYLREKYCS